MRFILFLLVFLTFVFCSYVAIAAHRNEITFSVQARLEWEAFKSLFHRKP